MKVILLINNASPICCIYMIKNTTNNKVYIGSTKNYKNRIYSHKSLLKNNKHHSKRLQLEWNKYGEENFEWTIIVNIVDEKLLKNKEQYYIDFYESYKDEFGYNEYPNSQSPLGYKYSDEYRKKLSESRLGENNSFYGKKHTVNSKLKISESHIGKQITDSQKKGLESGRGKEHFTNHTYEILSEKNRGENSGTAKLIESQVIEILEHLKNKTMTWNEISKKYHISETQISRIKNGKRWGYLKEIRGDLYEY